MLSTFRRSYEILNSVKRSHGDCTERSTTLAEASKAVASSCRCVRLLAVDIGPLFPLLTFARCPS